MRFFITRTLGLQMLERFLGKPRRSFRFVVVALVHAVSKILCTVTQITVLSTRTRLPVCKDITMATVTGYKLRTAVKSLEMKLQAAIRVFNDSLVKYPSEKKSTPEEVMGEILQLETGIAKLQAAQAEYNTKVKVDVL